MKNILFYKFTNIPDLERCKDLLLSCSKDLGLLGKILIAKEGINGCVSGADENISAFKELIQELLGPIDFKEGSTSDHTFKKMFVRIRKEIVTFKQDVDLTKRAPYIEPEELKELLDNGEDVVLLDARNLYESRIGRFRGAITPNILLFSQLPKALDQMHDLKEKRIVTYCTGGIRCEKSSAWMIERGFTNVQQLHGGIIRYGEECGDAHFEGKCFVFDRRGALDISPGKETSPISQCELCACSCSDYHNCALASCDKYFICCSECLAALEGCCSQGCMRSVRERPLLKAETSLETARPD